MLVQTSRADIPVMLSSQVKTIPEPQMVVRNVKHEKARDILSMIGGNQSSAKQSR